MSLQQFDVSPHKLSLLPPVASPRSQVPPVGDRTLLSPCTISKIVGREVGVDRRTLKQFFDAFNLPLQSDDYCMASYGAKPSSNLSYNDVAFVFYFRL